MKKCTRENFKLKLLMVLYEWKEEELLNESNLTERGCG